MVFLLLSQLEALVGLLALIVTFFSLVRKARIGEKLSLPPQPPGAWPFIGHVPLLGSHPNLGRVLQDFAHKLGPVFMLRLGVHRAVVVGSVEAAKECFTANDRALATRPVSAFARHMAYNYAMVGLAPYGPYWRQLRKIAIVELLSNARLDSLHHVRASEVDQLAKGLYKRKDTVDMRKWFEELTFNVVVRMVAGKRYYGVEDGDEEAARRFTGAMSRFFPLMGTFVLSDLLPFLGWLDFGGHEKAMKRTAAEMDGILGMWLEEHKEKRRSRVQKQLQVEDLDFMDVLLSTVEEEKFSGHDLDTIVKANCLNMIIGGTDTTSVSLTWALALLLNHPRVLKRAQEELDSIVGRERNMVESDVKSLFYLQAIVKESLRLYPVAPTLVSHEAMEDCRIGGFDVPAGTRLIVNAWAIQRDPRVWPEPLEFRPERFLDPGEAAGFDVRGQHFELLPFGSGRRSCPGISFSLQVMHLTLGRLIHGFDMAAATETGLVDMSEGGGVTVPKATPLPVTFKPRLPPHLYH